MKPVTVTVERAAQASPQAAFNAIVPIDLPSVFTGHGPLPAVTGVRDQVGAWDAAGNTRTVLLAGGGTMSERLVDVRSPQLCAYEVRPEHGPLRLLVDHIEGRFQFAPSPSGGTKIVWTYAFHPRPGTRAAVKLMAPLWRRYARDVIAGCARHAEAYEHPVD